MMKSKKGGYKHAHLMFQTSQYNCREANHLEYTIGILVANPYLEWNLHICRCVAIPPAWTKCHDFPPRLFLIGEPVWLRLHGTNQDDKFARKIGTHPIRWMHGRK